MMDLWFSNLEISDFYKSTQLEWLDRQELKRYSLIKNKTQAEFFAAAHIALRKVMGYYLDIPPPDVQFYKDKMGKPFVCNGPAFSLSHSGKGVFIAVASTGMIGADLEEIKPVNFQYILRDICSPAELKHISKDQNNHVDWLRFWVRKEAAVKALGVGIQSLCDVAIPLKKRTANYHRIIIKHNGKIRLWYLYDLNIDYGFIASVVTNHAQMAQSMRIRNIL